MRVHEEIAFAVTQLCAKMFIFVSFYREQLDKNGVAQKCHAV